MTKTYKDFPAFYENPLIQSLKNIRKWTISDNDKRPIDVWGIICDHRIYGASMANGINPYMTLTELCKYFPNAKNNTFLLDAITDKFVILDIEPKCPEPIKNELLKLPYVYGEISMSGNGYHLAFPLPDCIKNYPVVQNKIVMKEEHGYYEILLSHHVTFTRNTIPESDAEDEQGFERLFEEMAKLQKEKKKTEFDVSKEIDLESIPHISEIIDVMYNQHYKKTPDDFNGDLSNYEFGHIGFLYYKLNIVLKVSHIQEDHEYTDEERVHILYQIAKEVVPYRPKHDEFRNGLPWLLYLCREIIASSKDKKTE